MAIFPKNYIVQKEKFTRYKVFNYCPFFKKIGKRSNVGVNIFILDKCTKFWINTCKYKWDKSGIATTKQKSICISLRNGRWNVYQKGEKPAPKVKNISNNPFSKISPLLLDSHGGFLNKSPKNKKIIRKRIGYFLQEFLKRNNVKLKNQKKFTFEQNIFRLCYPNFPDYLKIDQLNSPFSGFFRNGDLDYVIKRTTRFCGKKLKRMVFERMTIKNSTNTYRFKNSLFSYLYIFKGLITLDDYYKIISDLSSINPNISLSYIHEHRKIRNFLKQFPRERILNFVINTNNYNNTIEIISDSARMAAEWPEIQIPGNIKKIVDIHNYLVRESLKMKQKDYEINPDEKILKIDGAKLDNLEFEVPKTYHRCIDISKEMSNCFSSYSISFKNNECILFNIKKSGETAYNLMIRNKRIIQLYGKHNSELPPEDYKKIQDFMFEKGLINEKNEIPVVIPAELPQIQQPVFV